MKAVLGAGLSELTGKLASFCGKRVFGKQQLTRLSVPYSVSGGEPSASQDANREKYGELVGVYLAASPEQKATWATLGAALGMGGFNYMLRDYWTKAKTAGAVWSVFGTFPLYSSPDALLQVTLPVPALLMFAGADFYRSTDGGATWVYQQVALSGYGVSCPLDLGNGVVVFMDTDDNYLWRSTDGGVTWEHWKHYTFYGGPSGGLGVSPDEWFEMSLADANVRRTTNAGTSFTAIDGDSDSLMGGAMTRLSSGVMLAGFIAPFAVSRSTDGGLNWEQVLVDEALASVDFFTDNGENTVLAIAHNDYRFYRSRDGGVTWSAALTGPWGDVPARFVYATAGELLAVAYWTGDVYRSTDDGDTWAIVGNIGVDAAPSNLLALGSGVLLVEDAGNLVQKKSVPVYM